MNRRKIITESLKSPNKLRRCLLAHGTHQYQMDKKLSVQRVLLQEPPSWAKRLVVQPVKDPCTTDFQQAKEGCENCSATKEAIFSSVLFKCSQVY